MQRRGSQSHLNAKCGWVQNLQIILQQKVTGHGQMTFSENKKHIC